MGFGARANSAPCRFPPEAFYHHGRGGHVLDVTKAPFFAKGDGVTDDTSALTAAMAFVRSHREVVSKHGKTACNPKYNANWSIYLPAGVYLVSDTVSQGWPAMAMNTLDGWDHVRYFQVASPEEERLLNQRTSVEKPFLHGEPELLARDDDHGRFSHGQYSYGEVYSEINWDIRIFGEGRELTVIRLRDDAPGFGTGNARAVLSFFLLDRGSNVNLGNFLENLTIDTGHGNPGAVALRWNSSNWGGVRNVCLKSGDGLGSVAMKLDRNNATGYCRDLILDGFDTGIELEAGRETMLVLEYATIRNMRRVGIALGGACSGGGGDCFNGRGLRLENMPVGLHAKFASMGVILDSALLGVAQHFTVDEGSFLLWRDVRSNGGSIPDGHVAGTGIRPMPRESWQGRPVREAPTAPIPYSPGDWVTVEAFGAAGDGRSDDTAAVQRAMNSGAKVICFTRSNYVVNGSVEIPESVQEVVGLFSGVQRAVVDGAENPRAIFVVSGKSPRPLLVHQFITGGGVFLDHEAERTVVLEDVMVLFNHCRQDAAEDDMLFPSAVPQNSCLWRLYRNSRPEGPRKELYVTDCIGFACDDGTAGCAVENVAAWCRFIDTEHVGRALYSFRRSQAWIFGFKSENTQTLIRAEMGSEVEVLGGTLLSFLRGEKPILEVEDSALAAFFLFWHWKIAPQTFRVDFAGHERRETPAQSMPCMPSADIAFILTS